MKERGEWGVETEEKDYKEQAPAMALSLTGEGRGFNAAEFNGARIAETRSPQIVYGSHLSCLAKGGASPGL